MTACRGPRHTDPAPGRPRPWSSSPSCSWPGSGRSRPPPPVRGGPDGHGGRRRVLGHRHAGCRPRAAATPADRPDRAGDRGPQRPADRPERPQRAARPGLPDRVAGEALPRRGGPLARPHGSGDGEPRRPGHAADDDRPVFRRGRLRGVGPVRRRRPRGDVAARYDLTRAAPPRVAGQWGEATTTAGDLARFLALLPVVPDPDDAATLLRWMSE